MAFPDTGLNINDCKENVNRLKKIFSEGTNYKKHQMFEV